MGRVAVSITSEVLKWVSRITVNTALVLAFAWMLAFMAQWMCTGLDSALGVNLWTEFTLFRWILSSLLRLLWWWVTDLRSWGLLAAARYAVILADPSELESISVGGVAYELLKSSFKAKVHTFASSLQYVVYLGVHSTVKIPNSQPVRYPLSHFISNLFILFDRDREALARATYRRVNPQSDLRLEAVRKYDVKQTVPIGALDRMFEGMADECGFHLDREFCEELSGVLSNLFDFDDISFEGSSAAGFPFKAGTKRRDAYHEAVEQASEMMREIANGGNPDKVFEPYKWYTTGRAKLVAADSPDSARLICYQAFALFLIMQKYAEPFTKVFVRKQPRFSAIGFSWFNRGANKLMSFFGAVAGEFIDGDLWASLDISNWDAGLQASYLLSASKFHLRVLKLSVPSHVYVTWKPILEALYRHMVFAEVMLPQGHMFKLPGGMKSGWNLTSVDNTIIHEALFRIAAGRAFGYLPRHKLYGDDNLFKVRAGMDMHKLFEAYAILGCKVKYIHVSKKSSGVDFLSKYIMYDPEGKFYYPFRATVETDARLIMPEHFNPYDMPATEAVAATEAIVGHLIDNFFNPEVRTLCYKMLVHIREHYQIDEVEVDRAIRAFRYKGLDITYRTRLPSVPSESFIRELYGAPEHLDLEAYAPANISITPSEYDISARDEADGLGALMSGLASRVEQFSKRVIGVRAGNVIKAKIRHFSIPSLTRGTAGMKVLEAISRCGVFPFKVLDIGAHPGSSSCGILNVLPDAHVTAVSTMFSRDFEEGIPFMYKAPRSNRLVSMYKNALSVKSWPKVDFAWIDIGFEDIIDSDLSYSERAKTHWSRIRPLVQRLVTSSEFVAFTVPELTVEVANGVFDIGGLAGEHWIFKPLYSYPWNPETVVILRQYGERKIRRSAFISAVRSWRNRMSGRLATWANVRANAVNEASLGRSVMWNPVQRDTVRQAEFIRHCVNIARPVID